MLADTLRHAPAHPNNVRFGEGGDDMFAEYDQTRHRGVQVRRRREVEHRLRLDFVVEDGSEQRRLVLKVRVDCHLRDGCALGDRVDRRRRDAMLAEQLERRVEDGIDLGEIAGPARAAGFALDRHHRLVIVNYWTSSSTYR